MNGWRELDFTDVIRDETGGNIKTLQKDYLTEGLYPIVDQGKALIAGYTDDSSRLCKSKSPVIVFGDHTKIFKFVDFQFCLGADGTKILKPKIPVNIRYLFFYFKTLQLPDVGYSRHFKYLKKSKVLLPSQQEQDRIAEIVGAADNMKDKYILAAQQAEMLAGSLMMRAVREGKGS